jgi:hypothetical protein
MTVEADVDEESWDGSWMFDAGYSILDDSGFWVNPLFFRGYPY